MFVRIPQLYSNHSLVPARVSLPIDATELQSTVFT